MRLTLDEVERASRRFEELADELDPATAEVRPHRRPQSDRGRIQGGARRRGPATRGRRALDIDGDDPVVRHPCLQSLALEWVLRASINGTGGDVSAPFGIHSLAGWPSVSTTPDG